MPQNEEPLEFVYVICYGCIWFDIAPAFKVHPADEEQLEQDVPGKGKNNNSMRIRKCYYELL